MDNQIKELAEEFSDLTIHKQMKVLAYKVSHSRIFFKEAIEEFEKHLLMALLEKHDYNLSSLSLSTKLHRNTINNKIKKHNIKKIKSLKS